MPGFPLGAIGKGLGIFAEDYRKDQDQLRQRQMMQMRVQQFMQEQQDRQKQQEGASIIGGLPSGAFDLGGGGGATGLPSGGSLPGATRMQSQPTPLAPPMLSPPGAPRASPTGAASGDGGSLPPPDTRHQSWIPAGFTAEQAMGEMSKRPPPIAVPGVPGMPQTVAEAGRMSGSGAGSPAGAPGGGGTGGGGIPPHIEQQGTQAAAGAAQGIPPDAYGRVSLGALKAKIDAAAPNADPIAKFYALEKLSKLLAPEERMQMQMYMMQNREALQLGLAQMRIDAANARAADTRAAAGSRADEAGWQFITKPDGSIVRANTRTGQVQPTTLDPGSGKMGQTAKPADQSEVDYWSRVLQNGGHLPPGLSRTPTGSQLVQAIMADMAKKGSMPQGMTPEEFIANVATVKADDRSLSNMTKMADAATSFERTASQNFDLALKLSKDAVPTDLGPFFNRWVESGQTQFGDLNVPPYVTAMLTGANEYAKIMSGSTGAQGSTVDSRREAAELFSPYLSSGQIERVVAVAKADMGNRKQSLYGQIDDIKGRLRSAGSKTPTATQGQPGAPPAPATQSGAPQPAQQGAAPKPGDVVDGYRFKGGNPADQTNWERVQ